MRAFAVRSFGEAPAIHDLPIPAADGGILIRVRYAGVNPIDYKLVERLTTTSAFPLVVGVDFAGVVQRVPTGELDFRAGDRVFGVARTHGTYAEYTAIAPGVQAEALARIPDGVTDEQAAALPIAAITALGSVDMLGVSAQQRIAVMGATGGVGGYAVQMARSRGAHVIATVRGDVDGARRLGADEVYDTTTRHFVEALSASHPEGVDAVLDLVNGSDAIRSDADILKPGGSLVSTLHAADEDWFAKRHITAHNISSTTNPLSSPQGLSDVAGMLTDGTITARITSTIELDAAGQLLDKLRKTGLRGKAVIRL
jgi:NADPH2:quinone reductase